MYIIMQLSNIAMVVFSPCSPWALRSPHCAAHLRAPLASCEGATLEVNCGWLTMLHGAV